MIPSQQQNRLLTFGYVRQNCSLSIPIVIYQLFMLFYNEWFYWNFKNMTFTQLLSMKNGDKIYSKSFKIKDIIFHCGLAPNGLINEQTNYMQLFIQIKSLPLNISNVTIHYQLYCK